MVLTTEVMSRHYIQQSAYHVMHSTTDWLLYMYIHVHVSAEYYNYYCKNNELRNLVKQVEGNIDRLDYNWLGASHIVRTFSNVDSDIVT